MSAAVHAATFGRVEVLVSIARDASDMPKAGGPDEAARSFLASEPQDGREHFRALYLDVRHVPLALYTVSIGCLTSSLVHPREVFRPAIVTGAAAVVLTHNHPSGNPEPSADDLSLTRRLAAAGALLGIEVLDHIVTGGGHFVSLKERGVL